MNFQDSSGEDMEGTYMHIAKCKKPIGKGFILCDSNYMIFWKRQNYEDGKKISGCQGSGVRGG